MLNSSTYTLQILSTAEGGAILYQNAYIQVKFDCNKDIISMNKIMPSYKEDSYKSYISVNSFYVLKLNFSLGINNLIDISYRFKNLYPVDCPLSKFRIS